MLVCHMAQSAWATSVLIVAHQHLDLPHIFWKSPGMYLQNAELQPFKASKPIAVILSTFVQRALRSHSEVVHYSVSMEALESGCCSG